MNKLQMKGSWNVTKGKLKQHFGRFSQGRADELVGQASKDARKVDEVRQMILIRSGPKVVSAHQRYNKKAADFDLVRSL